MLDWHSIPEVHIKRYVAEKVSADSQITGTSVEVGGAQACRFDEGVINDQL